MRSGAGAVRVLRFLGHGLWGEESGNAQVLACQGRGEGGVARELTDDGGEVAAGGGAADDEAGFWVRGEDGGGGRGGAGAPEDGVEGVVDAGWEGVLGREAVGYVDADGAEVAGEEAAVERFVGEVAHAPAAFVEHDDEGAVGGGGSLCRGVDSDWDGGAVADGDGVVGFGDEGGDGTGDRVEVAKGGEVSGAGGAEGVAGGGANREGVGFEGLSGVS